MKSENVLRHDISLKINFCGCVQKRKKIKGKNNFLAKEKLRK